MERQRSRRALFWAGSLILFVMLLALTLFIFLPRPVQLASCAVALLASLLSTLLAPDLLHARAPLSLFNWHYGHLLTFNGLTRSVLLVWPVAASAFLFALAGQPGWGEAR